MFEINKEIWQQLYHICCLFFSNSIIKSTFFADAQSESGNLPIPSLGYSIVLDETDADRSHDSTKIAVVVRPNAFILY